MDLARSVELAPHLPPELVWISESGLSSAPAIRRLMGVGYRGFLIGEYFMAAQNPEGACAELIKGIRGADANR